jgi:pilus assembly protein FimV
MERSLKKTVLHTAILALSIPITVYGLGLGKMTVQSALDQPFLAEIELVDVGNVSLADVKVALADPQNFAEIGIEPAVVLSFLNFKISTNDQGKPVVQVKSQERMKDPYMEVVVDLTWSHGQIYKAYTILLDPPGYQLTSTTIQGSKTYVRHVPSYNHSGEPGVIDKTIVTTVAHNPVDQNDSKKKTSYGPTVANESVWQIAQRYKTSEVILPQVVLAIVGANPDGFSSGNLNGLKVGVRLTIPSTAEIAKVPAELATSEVMAHDKAWNEKTVIDHVMPPPYTTQVSEGSNQSGVNSGTNTQQTQPALTSSVPQLIPNNLDTPLMDKSQASQTAQIQQNPEYAPTNTNQAELAITIAAIESVRESNAALMEQLRIVQAQNKTLQGELDKRNKEIETVRAQIKLLVKQRKAASTEVVTQKSDQGSPIWIILLVICAASGGAGAVYWYTRLRQSKNPEMLVTPEVNSEQQDIPNVTPSANTDKAMIVVQSSSEFVANEQSDKHLDVGATPIQEPDLKTQEAETERSDSPIELDDVGHRDKEILSVNQKSEETAEDLNALLDFEKIQEEEPIELDDVGRVDKETLSANQKSEDTAEDLNALLDFEKIQEEEPLESAFDESLSVQTSTIDEADQSKEEELLEFTSLEFEVPKQETVVAKEPIAQDQSESAKESEEEDSMLEFETGLHQLEPNKPQASNKQSNAPTVEAEGEEDMMLDFTSSSLSLETEVSDAQEPAKIKQEEPAEDEDFLLNFSFESKPIVEQEELEKTLEVDEDLSQFFAEIDKATEEALGEKKDQQTVTEAPADEVDKTSPLKSRKALDTLLELAKTYIAMEDIESARTSLTEVMEHGTKKQKQAAQKLLDEVKDK